MKIALYHGYELSGSGSNEYTRYLARTLAELGHDVVLICGEPHPEEFGFVCRAITYDPDGSPTEIFDHGGAGVVLHRLPRTSVYPVYVTDKQREGVVKAFPELSDDELAEYERVMTAVVGRVLVEERPDILHANHLVYQPIIAATACRQTGVPFYIVPHGSSIEYTIKQDPRFRRAAHGALQAAAGIVWIGREVRDRVLDLFNDLRDEIAAKSHMVGVGTDTSLFRPFTPAERGTAADRLCALHRPGGKTAEQRRELTTALDRLELDATGRYWDAYDHKVEDADLPAIMQQVPPDGDLIGFVGSMTYGKGIQSLIAALPGILVRRPAAHLVLVGSGTYREVLEGLVHALSTANEALFDALVARGRDLERDGQSGALEDLADFAADPGRRRRLFAGGSRIAERIHFLGRLDHERLRLVFPAWRVAVFPSIVKEASPLVFAEALAAGVLPMGAYHSGLRDGLDDLRSELPPEIWSPMRIAAEPGRRIASIVDGVSELLDRLDERELTGELRRIAEERYDWRAVAGVLVEAAAEVGRSAVRGGSAGR